MVSSLKNSNYSKNLNKSQAVEFEFIGMNEGFTGWNNLVWQDGENIYYLCEQGVMEWNNQNGSNLILNANGIGGIVIDDSWLYYYKSEEKRVNRIKLNEDYSPELVFDAEMIDSPEILEQICGFTLYNGQLYIKDTTISCFLYDMETGQLKRLNDDVSSGVFFDNKFYYIEHSQRSFTIYATDLVSLRTELLRGDGITYSFEEPKRGLLYDKLTVVNGKLFYSTRVEPAVYLYEKDGEDLLIEDFDSDDAVILQITTDGKYLFYTHENTNILHRYDPTECKLVLIELPDDFKGNKGYMIVNNILYYKLKNDSYKTFMVNTEF